MKNPVSMKSTAMAKKRKKEPKTSPFFGDNDKCFSPPPAKADSLLTPEVTSCQDYTDVFASFLDFYFLLLSGGSSVSDDQVPLGDGGPIFQPAALVSGADQRADLGD